MQQPSEEIVQRVQAQTTWLIAPAVESVLFPKGEFSLQSLLDQFETEILKSGPHRIVYRLQTEQGFFYLKHYKIPDWKARLQNWIRPSKSRIEWNHTWKLINLGFQTFQPVVLGEFKQGPFVLDSYLITQEIPHSVQLDYFVEQQLPIFSTHKQRELRFQLAKRLGELTAQLHEQGVQHHDFHAGNVLVTLDETQPANELQLWLIDLHQVQFGKRLSPAKRKQNFAILNSYFAGRGNQSDRRRFFHTYWNTQSTQTKPSSHNQHQQYFTALQEAETYCEQAMWKEFIKADQKWIRGNRRLIILEPEGERNHCRGVSELGPDFLEHCRQNPESLFNSNQSTDQPPNEVKTSKVEWTQFSPPKQVIVTRIPKSIDDAFSARNAWNFGHAFFRRRLPSPTPLLFVETAAAQYLVTEQIPNALSVSNWAEADLNIPFKKRRTLTRQLAKQLAWMHRCGFLDNRPTLSNVLLEIDSESIYFVGLGHFTQQIEPIDEPTCLETLIAWANEAREQSSLQKTDFLRFLKRYLGSKSSNWKCYWKRIQSRLK